MAHKARMVVTIFHVNILLFFSFFSVSVCLHLSLVCHIYMHICVCDSLWWVVNVCTNAHMFIVFDNLLFPPSRAMPAQTFRTSTSRRHYIWQWSDNTPRQSGLVGPLLSYPPFLCLLSFFFSSYPLSLPPRTEDPVSSYLFISPSFWTVHKREQNNISAAPHLIYTSGCPAVEWGPASD